MKLTIHKQLGDTAIDTTIEGSIDDCLKVIDHLKNIKGKKCKIEITDKQKKVDEFSDEFLDKLREERLVCMDEEDERTVIWLCNTNEHVLTPLHLSLDGDYPYSTLIDFQKALQEEVDKGTLFL